jgi:hypothetical protein
LEAADLPSVGEGFFQAILKFREVCDYRCVSGLFLNLSSAWLIGFGSGVCAQRAMPRMSILRRVGKE